MVHIWQAAIFIVIFWYIGFISGRDWERTKNKIKNGDEHNDA